MAIAPGLRASVRLVVTDTDTAAQIGSGDVSVLATPRLLALAEAAAVAAITPSLEPGHTSVGTAVWLEHKRASAVGAEVWVEAELTEVEGRRLVFRFVARQTASGAQPGGQRMADERPGREKPRAERAGEKHSGDGQDAGHGGAGQDGAAQDGAAQDGAGQDGGESVVVGAGTVERVIVDRERFLAGALR